MDLDFSDRSDFDDVERGFVGTLEDPVITAADGHGVDLDRTCRTAR